jgi:hypothetical protein
MLLVIKVPRACAAVNYLDSRSPPGGGGRNAADAAGGRSSVSFGSVVSFGPWRVRRVADLIPVRIDLVRARHDHDERPQRVQYLDGATLRGEHFGQAAVHVRTFVESAAAQGHALLA